MGTVYTIGHSTRSLDELVEMLKGHGVAALADVRRFAGSRRLPHFNAEHLASELPRYGLRYIPCPLLGGRRRPDPNSTNTGWRNESFRAYADYMQTPQFLEGLGLLIEAARQAPLVMMCAEAVPSRCHRSLIADALLVRGWEVLDIMGRAKATPKATPHKLTPFARVSGTSITYPSAVATDGDEAAAKPARKPKRRAKTQEARE